MFTYPQQQIHSAESLHVRLGVTSASLRSCLAEQVPGVNRPLGAMCPTRSGRGERIRTSDPLVPNQVLYQAEPLPDVTGGSVGEYVQGACHLSRQPPECTRKRRHVPGRLCRESPTSTERSMDEVGKSKYQTMLLAKRPASLAFAWLHCTHWQRITPPDGPLSTQDPPH